MLNAPRNQIRRMPTVHVRSYWMSRLARSVDRDKASQRWMFVALCA
jgi:hypothetical protein